MLHDEIITEVWRNRDEYAAEHGHDLARMVADLQERQQRPGRRVVDLREREVRPQSDHEPGR